ncbi:sporulation domain-containing protein [Alicycliphilus sp. B1]|uniref:Sporulation domain-containing protein n=2 Tax=Alicycliphilus denitrificans TaxID=179636 RepID=F4GGR7_ALIDK|nr:Sporulation domain-containing protein [Alicycliphilus denitrificans K601]GAO26869.1 sporulation domain-containing protein [Alicycliphilus sp. B1]
MARMPTYTAHAAHAADQPGAAAQYTSVAPALYRAALGPVNLEHYLAAFERLDATGRVLPGWNLAAALCPLGWLAFRRLWRQALLAFAALASGALLLWAVGHRWLALPWPMLTGLALAGLTVLCGGLGLYGDALVHADVRRRIDGAVSAASTMREAMGLLQRQASSRRRLLWVAVASAALAAAAAWLAFASAMGDRRLPDAGEPAPVALSAPEPAPRLPVVGGERPVAPAADPSPAATESLSTDQASAQPLLQAPEAESEPEVAQAQAEEPPQAKDPAPARPPQKAAQRRLYINVGLFADPENARRTQARLRQAGLPCAVEPLVRSDGRRLQRVRVGPFSSAAQANAAATKVRAMGLEAVAAAQ